MKQFIDKLISRLEEYEQGRLEIHDWQGQTAIVDAIEIVNQLAEEYKGGWVPCSERLPEEPEENPDFDYKPLELYLVCGSKEEYPFRAFWNGKFFTDGWYKLEVAAWMPLPSPYQKEGE